MPEAAKTIHSANLKIQRMINELDKSEKIKTFLRNITDIELQNIDKERADFMNEYERLFDNYIAD